MEWKRALTALGLTLFVVAAVMPLLGLSYVIYWGPTYSGGGPSDFVLASFWLGVACLAGAVTALAIAGYGLKAPRPTTPGASASTPR